MYITKTFVGKARAALKVSEIGQGRKIILQSFFFIWHSQSAVTHAGWAGLRVKWDIRRVENIKISVSLWTLCIIIVLPYTYRRYIMHFTYQSFYPISLPRPLVIQKDYENRKRLSSAYFVALSIRSTWDAGFYSQWLLRPYEGVRWTAPAYSSAM